MRAPATDGAHAPQKVTLESDEALALAGAKGFKGQSKSYESDSPGTPLAGEALCVIEGERQAQAYVARLRAQQAAPDELAHIASSLSCATLRGFCRLISKFLETQHG